MILLVLAFCSFMARFLCWLPYAGLAKSGNVCSMQTPAFVKKIILHCILFPAFLPFSHAAETDSGEILPERGSFGLGWLDRTQSVASNTANGLADQIDRFFGEPRSDLEAAYSSLRLSVEQRWHEHNNSDSSLNLRGKLYLPRISERLSLLFSEDGGEGKDYYTQSAVEDSSQESINANLQFNLLNEVRNRLDFRLGLRSSLKAKASIRYRHELPQGTDLQHRIAQTLYFVDGNGYGSLFRYQLDKTLGNDALLRWSSDLRFEEGINGAFWSSELSHSHRISDQTAMLYYGRMYAQTSPGFVHSYDIGLRLRKNISRPWLFVELEPGHSWSQAGPEAKRLSSLYFLLRLEMAIGRI